jgi:hypothetical protein
MMNDNLVEEPHDDFNGYGQNIEMFQQHKSEMQEENSNERKKKSTMQHHSTHSVSRTQQHQIMSQIAHISCGKEHQINLTRDGDVFSMGSG